jgi:hypothetical protein
MILNGGLFAAEAPIGIMGGQSDVGGVPPFAYLINADGTLTVLSGADFPQTSGAIDSVAIADSGAGIIGGQSALGGQPPIAYLVAPNGTLTALSGADFPQTSGYIGSVAIAENGAGIMGGQDLDGLQPPIAYLVAPNGTLTALSGADFPQTNGVVNSVAIAQSGAGIIGGQSFDGLQPPIAYLVAPNGTLTALTGAGFPQANGRINSVAIANSGAGIIVGGSNAGGRPPFAYLVNSDGMLMALSGASFPQTSGNVYSAAIAESGAGIISGQNLDNDQPFACLVAPNGTLTALTGAGFPQASGAVFSVAIVRGLAPKSFGPYSSLANALFALSHVFESHCTDRKKLFSNSSQPEEALLADSGMRPRLRRFEISENERVEISPETLAAPVELEKPPSWTAWSSFFGDLAYQEREGSIPAFSNEIAGTLAALEYNGMENVTIGGGLAYAFTYVQYKESIGHASINQEYALLYAEVRKPYLYFNAALWGGLYQMHNERHTLGSSLLPHISTATCFHHMWN